MRPQVRELVLDDHLELLARQQGHEAVGHDDLGLMAVDAVCDHHRGGELNEVDAIDDVMRAEDGFDR